MTVCPKCGNQWSMTTLDRVNVERIRELEAEVNRQSVITLKEKARAEKAEAARDSWRNQAKVQEARVAELEATVARLYRTSVFERQAEAREREGP